ncbi:hypothetical protein ACQKP1_13885 [Allorhizobium sp. NPDC080224]|uniref:hypothetical protein n=1 Tax=Allorhizobium sp. NPDC080224 TaxID=3390547 RepID=UPI003D008CB9
MTAAPVCGLVRVGCPEDIVEQLPILLPHQKPRQFGTQPLFESASEIAVRLALDPIEHECPDQDLASRIPGTLFSAKACHQHLLAGFQLSQSFLNASSGHRIVLRVVGSK